MPFHYPSIVRYVQTNRAQAIADARNPERQKNDPHYCAQIFKFLAAQPSADESPAEWIKWTAYCFALTRDPRKLTVFAHEFVKNYREQAILDAQNLDFQQVNPRYCAQLFSLLAESTLEHESYATWIRWTAYCFALAGEQKTLTPCTRKFIGANQPQAILDAQNPDLQQANPLYCGQLFNLLAEEFQEHESYSEWKRWEAYCLALVKKEGRSTEATWKFIQMNRPQAILDAQNQGLQQANPLYCAQLFNLLSQRPLGQESVSEWMRWAAYCYALANKNDRLMFFARNFTRTDPRQAMLDAQNPVIQQASPLYCRTLSGLLARQVPSQSSVSQYQGSHFNRDTPVERPAPNPLSEAQFPRPAY